METGVRQHDLPLLFHLDIGEAASLATPHHPDLQFRSSDPAVATVDKGGRIVGVAIGSVAIHASDGHGESVVEVIVGGAESWAPVDIAPKHPRLRLTAAERAARLADTATLAKFLAGADAILAQEAIAYEFEFGGEAYCFHLPYPPVQPGPQSQPAGFTDYPFWTRLSRQIEDRLTHLSLAWTLTGEMRYAVRAKSILLGICGWQKWHEYDKATNNLSLPHFTIGAALAYDELFDALTTAERATVRAAIIHLGLRPMAYWFERPLDHNIAVLMNVGMLHAVLAIGDEEPYLEKYLANSVAMLAWYLRQRDEGNVTEGLLYTSYAMATLLDAGLALRRVQGRTDLLESAYVRRELGALFAYQFAGRGGYANLSDTSNDLSPTRLLTQLAEGLADPYAQWLLAPDATATDAFPLDRHFARIDWVVMRSGWTGNDAVLVLNSGPSNVGHNHYDQNHFVLAVDGDWVVTDPGYQNYSPGPEAHFTTDSIGHNALLVNGVGQSARGQSRVVATSFSPDIAIVTGDATGAYEGRLKRWHRTFVFVRDGCVVLIDDIEPVAASDEVAILIHTTSQVTRDGVPLPLGTVSGPHDHVSIGGVLDVRITSGSASSLQHRHFPGAERYGTWLEYTISGARYHRVVTTLAWKAAIVAVAKDELTIRIEEQEHVVPLRSGVAV